MSWWTRLFPKKCGPTRSPRDEEQIERSFNRVIDDSKRQVEKARSELSHASHDAIVAIDKRASEGSSLQEALRVLIDRKTDGKFDLRPGEERRR